MIELYTAATPNGRKPLILLEELGLTYEIHKLDFGKKEQLQAEYLAINPNGKIPAIIDRDTNTTVFESGAILIYLAEKSGQFLPTALFERSTTFQWLMFQMASIGPMFGQLSHFNNSAPEPIPYAIHRYETETLRLCHVLDHRLSQVEFLAGDYSIADMATYPWLAAYTYFDISIENYPHIQRWLNHIQARPAVQRALAFT
jgi:GSH-dependent disulfide-bond oxidoreductase